MAWEIEAPLAAVSLRNIWFLAELIASTHHERWDGTGYPYGFKGEQIPLVGRICAVCDVFDALTSERPYKKAWTLDHAVNFLREGAGQHFDPACIEAFLASLDDVMVVQRRFQDEELPAL